ncbi:transposase, partial [Klebsiella pneumoniae]
RDILGLWIENTEGAKFWMKVFTDLKTRGVNDILSAVTDGLKGMPAALAGPAARAHVPGAVLRRAAGQDQGGCRGAQQG